MMVIQQELVISVHGRSYFGVLGQRDMIRLLLEKHGEDEETVVNAYGAAERAGRVLRESNRRGTPPEVYARGLFRGGLREGWIHDGVRAAYQA